MQAFNVTRKNFSFESVCWLFIFKDTEPSPLQDSCHGFLPGLTCVFITAGPIIKLCAGGGRGTVKDMCYEVRRAEACVD